MDRQWFTASWTGVSRAHSGPHFPCLVRQRGRHLSGSRVWQSFVVLDTFSAAASTKAGLHEFAKREIRSWGISS